MKIRHLWILIGISFCLLLIPVTISFYIDYQVYKNGKVVEAVITHLPSGYSSKTDFMDFTYNGIKYDKRVTSGFSKSHRVGDVIELKYLSEYEDHFLFVNESPLFWGVLLILLLIFIGGLSFYYAYIKRALT